jgi:hypothetical protein
MNGDKEERESEREREDFYELFVLVL